MEFSHPIIYSSFIFYYLCSMRVLIVNTSEKKGGAAVAANRLMEALNNNGVKAKMLVRDKETDNINVVELSNRISQKLYFLWERLVVFFYQHFSTKNLFAVDIANCGTDITGMKEFKEADVIHLHWINQGMLSLKSIRRILESGKPVVWTMHDIWPATGVCHITLGCNRFKSRCCNCRLLPGKGGADDLSAKIWRRKSKMLKAGSVHFVTCSKWLESEAKESSLLQNHSVTSIPNPIDIRVFCSQDKTMSRERCGLPMGKNVILFVSQRITNPNKGMNYLVDACNQIVKEHPEMQESTIVAVLGGHAEDMQESLPFEVYNLGYTSDSKRIVDIYNSASVFVLPSLSENLPNTIMEAMACAVPCVGFKVGGIPEEIDHKKNGYVAAYRDYEDLARGIYWVLKEADYSSLCNEAQKKVRLSYSQQSVAVKYIEVYNQALAKKHYKL